MPFVRIFTSGGGGGAAAGVNSVSAGNASVTIGGTAADPTIALPLSAATPLAPGTAAAGTSTTKSNDDHRHAPLIRFCTYHFLTNIPANATTALSLVPGDTNYQQAIFCRNAQLTGLACNLSGAPAGSDPVVSLKKNGGAIDTNLQLTITAGATRVFANTGTGLSVVSLDLINPVIVTDASWTSTTVDITLMCEWTQTA